MWLFSASRNRLEIRTTNTRIFCRLLHAPQERQRGLRVTVLEVPPHVSQPGFIDTFLIPYFTSMLPMAPGLGDEYLPTLTSNR